MNTLDKFSIDGKVTVVTGASGGLGTAISIALAEAGADVAIVGRNNTRLEELASKIRTLGRDCLPLSLDLTVPGVPQQMVNAVIGWKGRIDILCNNAGIINRDPAAKVTRESWFQVMGLNLDSAFFAAQAVGRKMIEAKQGKIINIGSLNSVISAKNVISYAASKGAILQMTKGLAIEWAQYNIQVNCIVPGYYLTDFTKALQADQERYQSILKRIPAGRWGEPEDLKGAVVFLASSASDYVTGIMLPVDGGYLAG